MEYIQTLSIDIESFSDRDLKKCGVYKYSESPAAELLLFGYSINNGPVEVIDVAQGEEIPEYILSALSDDRVTKWAYNSNFERVFLSIWLKRHYPQYFKSYGSSDDTVGDYLNPSSWRCSMVWGAYMGLPLSLKGVGAVLKLDEQKMSEGADLIRYFCVPCKPTKSNGERTRNLPCHAPDKWKIFKVYNKRDVEVELAIKEKLKKFPVPEFVWDEYHIDQQINDRGIGVDMQLVNNAIAFDEISKGTISEQMKNRTNLDNPNSVVQMRSWLADQGVETETLGKKAVNELMKEAPKDIAEILSLRQQLAKSSVKKYQAMANAVCDDSRARGMFMFYGANRTGRWCLTGDHEILTPEGWVRLDTWHGGLIACWNASSEAISFQHAEALQFNYSGPMYTYKDNRIDQCSTPDHKMRVKKQYNSEWVDMTVEEMSHCRPCIPMNGYHYHRGCANPAWLRVLIMTQADGSYKADGSIHFRFKKHRKIDRCKHLLRQAEIMFVVHNYIESTAISIPARAVPLWLRQFRTKTFGYWLLDENPDIFFDELPNWDGYRPAANSIQYCTCNKQNADIVQALAHMSGRCASIRFKPHSSKNPNWSDAYVVDIWLTPGFGHEIRNKPVITDFNGIVYCASTTTGYFLVRRGGKAWITGNSGRIIQLQNLPQNHMSDLAEARELVRQGDYEAMEMLYDDIPGTLSQLIRTAFVAKSGYKFYVADFSAIEARVIAYIAGESWRNELFKRGGDIYCQSASQMFHVPVEKHGINGHLRQKGKIAELACIAEGSLVLTDSGLVRIEEVTTDMKVWDGESWVEHEGVVFKGEREVITYEGLTATPDHLVWIEGKQEPVQFGIAASSRAHIIKTGDGRKAIRIDCTVNHPSFPTSPVVRTMPVYDIRNAGPHHRFTVSDCLVHNCGYGGSVGALKAMGALEMGLHEDELQPLVDAWRSSNPNIVQLWWDVDTAVKQTVKLHIDTETHGIKFSWRSGMLFITLPSGRSLTYVKPRIGKNKFGGESVTYEGIGTAKKWERIESYGPKFVENIVQAISRDLLMNAMKNLPGFFICGHVHDELIIECKEDVSLEDVCDAMAKTPDWMPDILLRADGYTTPWYCKA